MRKKKDIDSVQNDKCLICQFYIWKEDMQKAICGTKGCHNNSKFQFYKPSWMRRDEDATNYD
jgi:hypothetical protein